MPNTRDLKPGERIFAIFKGEPGSGKGAAAESFPNVYVADLDNRIRSTLKMHPDKEVDYDQFKDLESFLKKIEDLTESCPYETIHIASLTKLANMAVEYSMKYRGAGKETNKKELQGMQRGKIKMTDVQDWGVEFRVLTQVVDALQNIKAHVILEAHLISTTTDNIMTGARTVKRRLMTGAKGVAAYLPTCFDEAYHFYVDVPIDGSMPRYKARTIDSNEDWAKTALWLPPEIDFTRENGNSPTFYQKLQYYIKNPYIPKEMIPVDLVEIP